MSVLSFGVIPAKMHLMNKVPLISELLIYWAWNKNWGMRHRNPHKDLDVYSRIFCGCPGLASISKKFPKMCHFPNGYF